MKIGFTIKQQVKSQNFSIKDLENYSGIKAHTIRIWEQRYNLLNPIRTDTNIRVYTDLDLKKLLNVSQLIENGFKISHLAKLSSLELNEKLSEMTQSGADSLLFHKLKLAVLNYDEHEFNAAIDPLIATQGLEKTYQECIIPFLQQIGLLWQSDAICPAQEHFISALIRQKVIHHIELQKDLPCTKEIQLVLFLPELEIHELSMLMAHYILKSRGYSSLFLGQSVPMEDLKNVFNRVGDIHFVSIFTTHPMKIILPDYFHKLERMFEETECQFHFTGYQLKDIKTPNLKLFNLYPNLESLLDNFQ